MKKYFKIKVGIEEFPVEENDIPRIVEAMKNNDMVKLDCGIFRGSAILAVCRDESREIAFSSSSEKTQEELQKMADDEKIKQQRMKCGICEHTGLKEFFDEKRGVIRIPCKCVSLLSESNVCVLENQ